LTSPVLTPLAQKRMRRSSASYATSPTFASWVSSRNISDSDSNVSYPVFMPKPSTHRMHDPGSIVPYIQPKVSTDNQMSRIKYNYYISNVSKDYDDSQRNGTTEDSITPQEWQSRQHVT
jgi:hypothetical protein